MTFPCRSFLGGCSINRFGDSLRRHHGNRYFDQPGIFELWDDQGF